MNLHETKSENYLLVEFLHFDIGKKVYFGEFLLHQTLFVTLYCKYVFVYIELYLWEKELCRDCFAQKTRRVGVLLTLGYCCLQ